MEVILLERIAKLGQMGDTVRVKDGFARNFLLPKAKALRATTANKERFETERAQLEARNLEQRQEAEFIAEKINGETYIIIRQSGESGHLYGSVTTRNIADLLTENGVTIQRNQVSLNRPVKIIGIHPVDISLHPEVDVTINLNVARTEEEAERQARGEILVGKEENEFEFEPDDTTEGEQVSDSTSQDTSTSDEPAPNKSKADKSSSKSTSKETKSKDNTDKKSTSDQKSAKKSNDKSNTAKDSTAQDSEPEKEMSEDDLSKPESKSKEKADTESNNQNLDDGSTNSSATADSTTDPDSQSDNDKKVTQSNADDSKIADSNSESDSTKK